MLNRSTLRSVMTNVLCRKFRTLDEYVAHCGTDLDRPGDAQVLLQHRQVDHILAVVVEQQVKRGTVAGRLVAVPEARRIPAADTRGGARDPEQRLDTFETTTQPALPADVQQ